jgi:hypothetical protein
MTGICRLLSVQLWKNCMRHCSLRLTSVIWSWFRVLSLTFGQLPDEAKALAVQQLQTLAAVARGLTRTNESLLIFDDSPDIQKELEQMERAREDPRVIRIREAILDSIRRCVELWSTDAGVSNVWSPIPLGIFDVYMLHPGNQRALQSNYLPTVRHHASLP